MIQARLCWIWRSRSGWAADVGVLRAEPGVFGALASDPTVSRMIAAQAADAPKTVSALRSARDAARTVAWDRAGEHAPDHGIDAEHPLIIDLDATVTVAHSEKECATPTFKMTFGHHSLGSWVDHVPTAPVNHW